MNQKVGLSPQNARDLRTAVLKNVGMNPTPGAVKSISLLVFTLLLAVSAFKSGSFYTFILLTICCATIYAAMIILTHDAIHTTLTGNKWYDEVFPRLISWPVVWFHGIYKEVHLIHHRYNGIDLRDPERVQKTQTEYETAS